jgi:hypothetical protein
MAGFSVRCHAVATGFSNWSNYVPIRLLNNSQIDAQVYKLRRRLTLVNKRPTLGRASRAHRLNQRADAGSGMEWARKMLELIDCASCIVARHKLETIRHRSLHYGL